MSGLFKRLSGRRSAGPEGSEPPTAAEQGTADAPATPTAESGGHKSLLTDPAAPTRVLREGEQSDPDAHTLFGAPAPAEPAAPVPDPAPIYGPAPSPDVPAPFAQPVPPAVRVEPVADLPAGLDPDELAAAPGTSARRGKLRRRIAFLRAARELLLRDLGGFVYELHRTAHDVEHDAHRRLRETKLARLGRVDAELHELEVRLDDVRRQVVVREPGVGGECPHCGELYASAAHYCSNCGNPLTESARRELAKAQAPVAEPAVVEPPVAVDQSTQEIPPLDPEHPSAEPDFKWPSREPGGAVAATASGVDLRKATPGDDTPAAPVGETGADEPAAAPIGEARAEEPPAAPVGEAERGDEPPPPVAETRADAATSGEIHGEEHATAPVGETGADAPAAAEATPEETPAAAAEPASGDSRQARNGSARDGAILRPVERRQ